MLNKKIILISLFLLSLSLVNASSFVINNKSSFDSGSYFGTEYVNNLSIPKQTKIITSQDSLWEKGAYATETFSGDDITFPSRGSDRTNEDIIGNFDLEFKFITYASGQSQEFGIVASTETLPDGALYSLTNYWAIDYSMGYGTTGFFACSQNTYNLYDIPVAVSGDIFNIKRNEDTFTLYRNGNIIYTYPLKYSGAVRVVGGVNNAQLNIQDIKWTINPDYTKLLLHFDGPNQSQTHFYDSSPSKHTLTINGNTKLDSSNKMFGESSVYFDGSGDYITIPDSDDWDFGTNDFTIDFWIKPTNMEAYDILYSDFQDINNFILFDWGLSNNLRFLVREGGTDRVQYTLTSSYSWNPNIWYHIALVREDDEMLYFINGIKQTTTIIDTLTSGEVLVNPTTNVRIGGRQDDNYYANAYFDEYRITKGKALWTSEFEPPKYETFNNKSGIYESEVFDTNSEVKWENITMSSNQINYEKDSNIQLLLECEGTDNSQIFTDSSESLHTITPVGNVKIENTQKKIGKTSCYFDGNGDYLTIPASTDFDFGTIDFTIDMWVNFDNDAPHYLLYWDTSNNFAWDGNTNQFYIELGGNFISSPVFTPTYGSWHHLAYTRSGTDIKLYVDGTLFQTGTATGDLGTSTSPLQVGTYSSGSYGHQGYIDNLRITKGKILWNSNFVPPQSESDYYEENPIKLLLHFEPKTNSENKTMLLMHFDGNLNDETGNYVFTSGIYTHFDSSIKKFGSSSIDSSRGPTTQIITDGPYTTIPTSDFLNFQNGDFTIEGWMYNAAGGGNGWIGTDASSYASNGWQLWRHDEYYFFFINGIKIIEVADSTTDTWQYVTLMKKDNTVYLLINGVLKGSGTWQTPTQSTTFSTFFGNYAYNHKLDELRISNYAIYPTTGFTAPTTAFTAIDLSKFSDSSESNHIITTYGDAKLSNTQKRFGNYSGYFDGNGDYLSIPDSEDWNFGSEDFTIDFWLDYQGKDTSGVVLFSQHAVTNWWSMYVETNDKLSFSFNNAGVTTLNFNVVLTPGFKHYAFVREGTIFSVYINGVKIDSLSDSRAIQDLAAPISIGGLNPAISATHDLTGYLDEVRITKGKALWTSNFEPPNKEYYNKLNYIGLQVQTCSDSICSDGNWQTILNGDLSNLPKSQYLQFRTIFDREDFTLNPEIYNFTINLNIPKQKIILKNLDTNIETTDNFNSGTLTNLTIVNNNLTISGTNQTGEYISKIYNLGEVKQITLINWNPKNTETDYDTKLLLHCDGLNSGTTFVDSSSYLHLISVVGNAITSTAQSKFGGSSCYFDGSGDYLSIPNSNDWTFGTENFTIDFWTYPTGGSSNRVWMDYGWNSGWNFFYDSGLSRIYFYSPAGTTDAINSGSFAIPNNVWTHVAITREGNIFKIYANGVQYGTWTASGSLPDTSSILKIGLGNYGTFTGYLDEIRISKGIAKWNSAFTPQTTAYENSNNEGNLTFNIRTCDDSLCSGENWRLVTQSDLSNLNLINNQYVQFKINFEGNILLRNVSINYRNTIIPTTQYFVPPTPENKSNLMKDEVIINVSSSSTISNCILNINGQSISMINSGTYCYQNYSNFENEITEYYYNVTFIENSESKSTENRLFTYYPDYSEEAMPAEGLISGIITILIIIGGLFL